MAPVLQVIIGGSLGSLVRYGIGLWLPASSGNSFPWNTFAVNLAGCFIIGLLFGFVIKGQLDRQWWPILFTGFLGGFTTFSSFGLETFNLIKNKELLLSVYYILGTNIVGLLLVFAGYKLSAL